MNHKFFILYLFYIVYFCVQIMGPFVKLLFIGSEHLEEDPASGNLFEYLVEHPNELIVFFLCCMLILIVGLMFMYQIFLLLMNKTTLEVSMDAQRSPFRHRSIIRNIEMVFGSRKCTWFSPCHDPFPNMKLIAFTPSQR